MSKNLQTKLDKYDREELITYRQEQKNIEVFHYPDARVTIAIRRTGEYMAEFSIALASYEETKYRKKVGEFLVRLRMNNGMCMPARMLSWQSIEEVANNIAGTLS